MGVINVQPREFQNGDKVTSYTGTVGTTQETFTFLASQETVSITNKGTRDLNYTIGATSGTLKPSESKKVTGDFSAVSLSSERGTQQFELWAEEKGYSLPTAGVGNGILTFPNAVDLQAKLPNGSESPVWVVDDNAWYYWTTATDITPPTVTASSAGGTFASAQAVTLSSEAGAIIYYTTDGTTPTESSYVYSGAITISSSSALKFFAKDTAGNKSAVHTITFTINTATDYFMISPSTSKNASGTGGYKGNSFLMKQSLSLYKIGVSGSGAPSVFDVWSMNSTGQTLGSKIATVTAGAKDGNGFYSATLDTPLSLANGSYYFVCANNTLAGCGFLPVSNAQNTAAFDAVNSRMQYNDPVAGGQTDSGYIYDFRLTLG